MPVSTVDSQTPHVLELATPAEVNSGGQVVITPEAMTAAGAMEEWLSFVFTATALTISPTVLNIPPPCTGTFVGLITSSTGQPGGSIAFTPSISGTNVPDGAVTLASTDVAGTVKTSTASSGNAVAIGGPVLRVAATVASPGNQVVTLLVGFRRA